MTFKNLSGNTLCNEKLCLHNVGIYGSFHQHRFINECDCFIQYSSYNLFMMNHILPSFILSLREREKKKFINVVPTYNTLQLPDYDFLEIVDDFGVD